MEQKNNWGKIYIDTGAWFTDGNGKEHYFVPEKKDWVSQDDVSRDAAGTFVMGEGGIWTRQNNRD